VMYFDAGTPDFDKSAIGVRLVMTVAALATALFVFMPGPVVAAAADAAKALMG